MGKADQPLASRTSPRGDRRHFETKNPIPSAPPISGKAAGKGTELIVSPPGMVRSRPDSPPQHSKNLKLERMRARRQRNGVADCVDAVCPTIIHGQAIVDKELCPVI